jgi:hypothetical protein
VCGVVYIVIAGRHFGATSRGQEEGDDERICVHDGPW